MSNFVTTKSLKALRMNEEMFKQAFVYTMKQRFSDKQNRVEFLKTMTVHIRKNILEEIQARGEFEIPENINEMVINRFYEEVQEVLDSMKR